MGISPIGPVPMLATQAHVGHAEAVTDVDGVMRQAYLRTGWGTSQWPHLAQLLLDISQHSANPSPDASPEKTPPLPAVSGEPSAWSRQQPISLRFYGPPGTVTTVSYADVLAGSVAPEVFKERIVLIGATAQGLGDRFMTPVSGNGQPMASVEIVAQMVGMLRQDRLAQRVPPLWVGVMSAALLFGLMALYWPRPPRQGLFLSLAAIVAIPMFSIAVMGWGIWFAPGAFMLMAAISYPMWSWRRMEVASDYLSTQLASAGRQLSFDNGNATATQTAGFLERQAHAIATLNEERQATYQLIEQLIQQLPCAVLLVDANGQVARFNEQFKQLLNADASGNILGRQVKSLLEDWQLTSVTDWAALLQDLDTDPVKSTEAKGPQGQSCQVNVVPMRHLPNSDGTPTAHGVIICLTDTTAAKRAETQRDELLSFIAHDMRSPQASLLSLVELHQMNPAAMPIPDLLKHAENLAHGTLALCEELIHVIRSENSPLRLQHHHIGQIVLAACELSAPQAMTKQVTLVTTQLDQADAWMDVDAGQLQRAITNLLSNAIRFSPEGGEVQVRLRAQPDTWDIEVHDRGEGISSDNLAKLFRRYSRLNTAGNQPNKGFGLGLVFVETVFKRHGGSVLVNSSPGQGSVFTGRLPRHQPK